jgi:malonyl-CoA/methylmalonyl-CoA synthetase
MASGSAPLNSKLFNNWFNLTGFRLVERYGLTEAGVCLSNSCDETLRKRIAGHVGRPFGELKVRIAELNDQHMSTGRVLIESDSEKDVLLVDNLKTKSISGELQIKGPMVFKGYQNAPEETKDAFTSDGWLKTGIFGTCVPNIIKIKDALYFLTWLFI